jgi:hypothetical protein
MFIDEHTVEEMQVWLKRIGYSVRNISRIPDPGSKQSTIQSGTCLVHQAVHICEWPIARTWYLANILVFNQCYLYLSSIFVLVEHMRDQSLLSANTNEDEFHCTKMTIKCFN